MYSSTVGPPSANNFGGCKDGRLNQGATDLYSVPYNGGNGGEAIPVPGASDKDWEEFYAAYSPDDQMVLFDRVPSGQVTAGEDRQSWVKTDLRLQRPESHLH